jgi:hypothetical protein
MHRIRRARPASVPAPVEPPRVRRRRKTERPRYIVDWSANWGQKLQLYLMASYSYYCLNRSFIHNDEYDRLCKELAAGWRTGKHQHKHLITLGDLEAVTGYAIQYPRMVMGATMFMLNNHCEV